MHLNRVVRFSGNKFFTLASIVSYLAVKIGIAPPFKVKAHAEYAKYSIQPLSYATAGSSGMDIRCIEDTVIPPGKTVLVATGVRVEMIRGYELQVRPRSGLALKNSVGVLNAPGTIDSDYIDEIKIIMHNFGDKEVKFNKFTRVAQLVLAEVAINKEIVVIEKNRTGGFGSTGSL